MAIDKIIDRAATISVTSTDVSDDANTSTGALDIPAGTTAERPSSPTSGNMRFNTDLQTVELYDGTTWGKVSPLTPTLTSVTGTVYTTLASNLTLTGTNFLTGNLVVGFTPSGGSETTVTVTPTSDTSATVAVPSAIYNQSGGTSVSVTVTNSDNRTSGAQSITVLTLPTGGDHVFTQGSARVHIFKSSSDFVVPSGVSLSNVEYLIVGGGGGGARNGGGGGAGGLRSSVVGDTSGRGASAETRMSLSAATYPVVVGTGGTGAASGGGGGNQTNGVASSFNSISATGGGAGGEIYGSGGAAGGSGGGGAGYSGTSAGAGTSGQGYDGGAGYTVNSGGYCGGGGGGAGQAGFNGDASASGEGGDGQISTIITTSEATTYSVGEVVSSDVYFAGGGHGYGAGTVPSTTARAAYGGGGQSHQNHSGDDYTGGGGGANTSNGGDGGDGVVIIRYTL